MTRFQAKALPQYTPQPYQSPLAGIWNMISAYYSTSPRFRNWLADLFTSKEKGESGYEQPFDTSMTYPGLVEVPEFGSPEAATDTAHMIVGDKQTGIDWLDRIAEGVRENNDYEGGAVRRALMDKMPKLKEDISWLDSLK